MSKVEQEQQEHRPLVVASVREVADRVLEVVLKDPHGAELPAWEPGAHVQLQLPSGLRREYSLCGDPADRTSWTVAVLEEAEGRGGSRELHRLAAVDAVLHVRDPKNEFPLEPAERYLFIAGGIGVTPLLTMVEAAQRSGTPWTLVYGGRSRATMAYVERLTGISGGHLDLWPEDERGRPDLKGLLTEQPPGTVVYTCGPSGLLDAVIATHAEVPGLPPLRFERFGASGPVDASGDGFEVVLAKTGTTVVVPPDTSVLSTVRKVLPKLSYSCEEGYCGECEVKVLEGDIDHRDDYLDEEEQASGETMMICVSRCRGARLVLDL